MRQALISFPMLGDSFVLNPPASFSIGGFSIYLYGVVIALGFLLAVFYVSRIESRIGVTMDQVYDLLIFTVPAAIVGARLYYVIFYWSLYAGDFWGVFRIRDGGLAIYGGVIGTVVALVLRCRAKKMPVGSGLDIAAFGLPVGQCVGRWGNFFNREAYGYETDVFCRMGLTPPGGETVYVHPTFLYESLWSLLGLIVLHTVCKKHRKYTGQFFILYVAWYGVGRAVIEGLRADSLWLVPGVIRVSQLLAAVSAAAAIALYLVNDRRLKKGLPPALGGALDGGDFSGIMEETENQSQAPSLEADESQTPENES